MVDLTLEHINKVYVPNTVKDGCKINDYNSVHDYMNISEIRDIDQLERMEHSGALRVNHYGQVTSLCKVAIHEDVFQNVIIGDKINFENTMEEFRDKFTIEKETLSTEGLEPEEQQELIKWFDSYSNNTTDDINEEIINRPIVHALKYGYLMRNTMRDHKINDLLREHKWLSMTNVVNDIENNIELEDDIIEAFTVGHLTCETLYDLNMEFKPMISSGQQYSYKRNVQLYQTLISTIGMLSDSYDEETISHEVVYVTHYNISKSNIKERLIDWFGSTSDEYKEYLSLEKNIPESFQYGDNTVEFYNFGEKYDIFAYVIKPGDIINVKD